MRKVPAQVISTGMTAYVARLFTDHARALNEAADDIADGARIAAATPQGVLTLTPPTTAGAAQTSVHLYAGTGVPSNSHGVNGDYYFRGDTPGTANQRIYVKSAGAWVGIL